MEAPNILDGMLKRYSECRSYADSGTIVGVSDRPDRLPLEFRTYFCRPRKFRLEWTDHQIELSGAVWSDGLEFYTYMSCGDQKMSVKRGDTIERAFAQLGIVMNGGIMEGSGLTILTLLLGEEGLLRSWLLELDEVALLGQEEIGGESCFRLIASNRRLDDMQLWISANNQVLRKIRHCDRLTIPYLAERYFEDRKTGRRPRYQFAWNNALMMRMNIIQNRIFPQLRTDRQCTYEYRYGDVNFDIDIRDSIFARASD
jgi:hypothetical protein